MKITKAVRRHPYRTLVAIILILGLAAAEVAGYAKNPTHDAPEDACVSPPTVSSVYVEPSTNTMLQTYSGLFTTGVVARGKVEGAYGVQASYKSPHATAEEWDAHASQMIKANDDSGFALKMAIGSGEVEFGVQVIAPAGSELCNKPPEVTYQYYDRSGYFSAKGTLPWPNPVNVISNLI